MLRATLFLGSIALLTACTATSTPAAPAAPADPVTKGTPELWEVPGPEHAALAPFVGSFKARVAHQIPGEPELVATGSYDVRWMGGLWLVGMFKSDSVEQPFEGTSLSGYDLQTKQYTTWWFDTASSAPQFSRGTWDPATRQMIMNSDAVHAMPASRSVNRVNDDGSIKSEVFAPGPDGKEFRVMYVEYTRR